MLPRIWSQPPWRNIEVRMVRRTVATVEGRMSLRASGTNSGSPPTGTSTETRGTLSRAACTRSGITP